MRAHLENHSFESTRREPESFGSAPRARDATDGALGSATHRAAGGTVGSAAWRAAFSTFAVLAVAALLGGAVVGCERTRLTDGIDSSDRCTACHGMPGNPAPPYGLDGQWQTTDLGVGAHQTHLVAGSVGADVPCYECHPIPTDLLNHPNWSDRPTTVTFGGLASLSRPRAAAGAATWDRVTATCTNVYCHGATLADAAQRTPPLWIRVDGTQKACNSCHGNPPNDSIHQTTAGCETCHGAVVGPGRVITNRALHVDGKIDLGGIQ